MYFVPATRRSFLPQGRGGLPADVEPWMLDTTTWPGGVDNYVDSLVWLVGELLTAPKHSSARSPSRNSAAS